MLIEQVDAIGPEPLQRRVSNRTDLRRPAVEASYFTVDDVEPELRGDRHPVSDRLQGFPDEVFVRVGPVHFGCIEERHACVDGCPDDGDAVLARRWPSVALADTHAAETERGNLESIQTQRAFLHCCVS